MSETGLKTSPEISTKTSPETLPETSQAKAPLPAGTFSYSENNYDYSGTIYVRGYADVQKTPEAFCDPAIEQCKTYDYVFFHILEKGQTPGFEKFVQDYQGNSFIGANSIGLGCVTNGKITYSNDNDEKPVVDGSFSTDLSGKILNSSTDQPIALVFTKKILGGGMGAPSCYSHFATVEELK